MSSVNLKKERDWYAKFNLKPLDFWKRIYYWVLFFYSIYPKKIPEYRIAEIEKFVKSTKAKINYLYAHRFFATYEPHYKSRFNLEIKNWTYEIFLPFPELYQGNKELKQKYYYFTLFHELIHWTGCEFHLKRFSLERPIKLNQLTQAAEEIIAAYGCLMLMKKFDLYDDEVNERVLLYIKDYLASIIYELSQLGIITIIPGWTLNDYVKNEPVITNYVTDLVLKADKAVEYLENFQK